MKKIFLLILLCLSVKSYSQLTREQRIQDSVIGWWRNNHWDRKWKTPTDTEGKIIDKHLLNFIDWMKKSYTLVGGLGTVTRFRDDWGYGVKFNVWNVTYCCDGKWLDEKGLFKPVSEENTPFYIWVNQITGAYPMSFLNKNGDYYFTWMTDGTGNLFVHQKKDPRPEGIHPNASQFITVRNDNQTVMLAPENKLPFVKVTKRELLEKSDKALAEMIVAGNQNTKEDYERYRKTIAELKEKYKASLDEPAVVRNFQADESVFNFSDPFELHNNGNPLMNYPVYKLAPGVLENMKKAQPQWITIYYPFFTKESGTQKNELYTALTQNLNYEYIYNYFFNPEKIMGKPYTPYDEAGLKARLDNCRNSNKQSLAAKPTNFGGNVHFADDFSNNSPGDKPKDWFFNQMREHVEIRNLQGEDGNWAQLGKYNPLRPNLLKYPLPKNFKLEFELITDTDFSVRTGGVARLTINTRKVLDNGNENTLGNGETLNITFASGAREALNSNNFRGAVTMEVNSNPSKNKQNGAEGAKVSIPMTEFTNRSPKIKVAITVQDGIVEVSVNGERKVSSSEMKLAHGGDCVSCGLDPASLINCISWSATTESNSEAIKVYLGSVVIKRL